MHKSRRVVKVPRSKENQAPTLIIVKTLTMSVL